jgi:hypothetical protein
MMIWPLLAHEGALSITHELAVLMKPTAVGAGRIPRLAPMYGNSDLQSIERPLVTVICSQRAVGTTRAQTIHVPTERHAFSLGPAAPDSLASP